MIEKFYRFTCADCKTQREYPNRETAQAHGWGIAHGGKKCYCPACAMNHRNVGKGGFKPTKQINISEIC